MKTIKVYRLDDGVSKATQLRKRSDDKYEVMDTIQADSIDLSPLGHLYVYKNEHPCKVYNIHEWFRVEIEENLVHSKFE